MEQILPQILKETGTLGLVLVGIFLFAKYILNQLSEMTKNTSEERKTLFNLITQVPTSVAEILASLQNVEAELKQLSDNIQELEKKTSEHININESRLKEYVNLVINDVKRDHISLEKSLHDLREAIAHKRSER